MLDKDFDKFFKSSFEDFETEPAADSWAKISEKINRKRKKKAFPVFWAAAASTIIVFGIAIGLFTKPTRTIKLHPDGKDEVLAELAEEQKETARPVKNIATFNKTVEVPVLNIAKAEKLNESNVSVENIVMDEPALVNEPHHLEYAATYDAKPIRPKLVTEQLLEQEEITDLKKQGAVTLGENKEIFLADASTENSAISKRLKISSVGDLVNFVVGKVDKREEKIIRISKTNESDNEIIGINLGLIKFTKRD